MIGAIIGDIVGSRFEFNNFRGFGFDLFHKDCQFTDDTVCTVAIAEAILDNYSFEEALLKWCAKYPNPMGGYGSSFRQWLISGNGPYNSYGNGSAMRVSSVGWLCDTYDDVLVRSRASAMVTHSHPEGVKGAQCIALGIYMLRNGASKEDLIKRINFRFGYDLNFTCNQIRRTNVFNETCQVTVPQAIVCFIDSEDFESAIRLAVSIGGDSDTIAAITGSLAEAAYGVPQWMKDEAMSRLPIEMINVINKFNEKRLQHVSLL